MTADTLTAAIEAAAGPLDELDADTRVDLAGHLRAVATAAGGRGAVAVLAAAELIEQTTAPTNTPG